MEKNYVKQETMLLVALAALVVGFFSGVTFTIFKTAPGDSQRSAPQAGSAQQPADVFDLPAESAARIVALEKEVAAHPNNLQAWVALGNTYFDTHQPAQAIVAYNKALELDASNANVWTDLGVMYREVRDFGQAIASFDRAITLNPRHEQSRLNKGVVLFYDLHDKEGAIQAWEDLQRVNPAAVTPSGEPIGELIKMVRGQ